MFLKGQMSSRESWQEALWVRLVAELLRHSQAYAVRGQGVRFLRCEALLKDVEAFLDRHGRDLGLVTDRLLRAARQCALMRGNVPQSGPFLEWARWEELARTTEDLTSFVDLESGCLLAAHALAVISARIRAMASVMDPTLAIPFRALELGTPA